MKKTPLLLILVIAAALLGGCGTLTTSPGGNPNRMLSGIVSYSSSDTGLPPDAEVVVRLIDTAGTTQSRIAAANKDLPIVNQPKLPPTPQLIAEQIIKAPAPGPIPFRLEYTASDDLLRHGLNLEARISYGGRVRMRTVNFRAVTLGNSTDMHEVRVEAVSR